ncbi:hypothetical protein HYG86_04395 [Alkalicella caledoniensis]|uniref:Uncharacterized protein n=1 Tax=Alkalicella caledoniensis TaxID=2731377 RepID=A0A7G9W5V4_ALKCA|nr:hypothetical protein [Alkalicella caledoniensis]QNO14066.1 hypothetical protein HYG86_04395 [Alkalicella caledoniensis]
MNPVFFVSFIPIFVLLFVILPQHKKIKGKVATGKIIKKKRRVKMSYEALRKLIGKKCSINTLDQYVEGQVLTLDGNWLEIEVETRKGYKNKIEMVNVEFIEKISIED